MDSMEPQKIEAFDEMHGLQRGRDLSNARVFFALFSGERAGLCNRLHAQGHKANHSFRTVPGLD